MKCAGGDDKGEIVVNHVPLKSRNVLVIIAPEGAPPGPHQATQSIELCNLLSCLGKFSNYNEAGHK